jgi:predicted transcriptional regulator
LVRRIWKMKKRMYGIALAALLLIFGAGLFSCGAQMDEQRKVEAIFIKHLNKTAAKLELSAEQQAEFENLKEQIHQNFQEGRTTRQEIMEAIKREGAQQQPDVTHMTQLFQEVLSDKTQRINSTFDLMLEFSDKLDEPQREKLASMVSDWVARWD